MQRFPDNDRKTYLSADSVSEADQAYLNSTKFLNSLAPSGLPPHKLRLRKIAPIILLRNLEPKQGLLNGTRLRVASLGTRNVWAEIMTGKRRGDYVFLPRITLIPSDSGLPFDLRRRQFPLRLAYSMTVNKS